MQKHKGTKRLLLSSILSFILCMTMFISTTLAWFTDTISVLADIETGTLIVDLEKNTGDGYKSVLNDQGVGVVFDEENWKPNQMGIYYLAVANKGKLEFNYNMEIVIAGELAPALEYAIIDKAEYGTVTAANWTAVKALESVQTGQVTVGTQAAAPNGYLDAGEKDYFALIIWMKDSAGDEYQGKDIDVSINVNARQVEDTGSGDLGNTGSGDNTGSGTEQTNPWAGWTVAAGSDFTNGIVGKWGKTGIGVSSATLATVQTESDGNAYLKCVKAATDNNYHVNLFGLMAYDATDAVNGIKYTESGLSTDVLVYKFDLMVLDKASTFWAYLDPTLVLGQLTNGTWYCGSTSSGSTTGVKGVELKVNKWYTMAAEINYTAKTVSYYVDGEPIVENVTLPSTYTDGTLAAFMRIHYQTKSLWYQTDDAGNNIEVGIDNMQVLAKPVTTE